MDCAAPTQAVSLGTTVAAVTYDGGVILAADSRTTTGSYIANRVTDKITPLSDNVSMLRSGSAAATQAIANYVQYFIAQHQAESGEQITVKLAANMAAQLSYQNKDAFEAGLIVAGYDEWNKGSVYALPMGGYITNVPFATGGSGSAYIYGFCDKYFKPGMTEEEARTFIVKAVKHAMARDGSSGGCIRLLRIDGTGQKREFLTPNQQPLSFGELVF